MELKLKAIENIQGGAEEISESLDVSGVFNNAKSHVLLNCKSHYIQNKLQTTLVHKQNTEYLESPVLSLDSTNHVLNSDPPQWNEVIEHVTPMSYTIFGDNNIYVLKSSLS